MHALTADEWATVDELAAVRSKCPALSKILLPDQDWSRFRQWHETSDTVGHHRSMVLLALGRRCLSRLTSPIHRYLLDGEHVRPEATQQYLQDLRERWMFASSPLERHKRSRTFRGRIVELQFAEWLHEAQWAITGLEALGHAIDVEAEKPNRGRFSFEVKFIGTEDDDFCMIVRSLAGRSGGGSVSMYSAANYLLFRIYEAAKQLSRARCVGVAAVVIENLTWWRFDFPLENNYIDWRSPRFLHADHVWDQFVEEQLSQYPDLHSDLAPTIRGLDAVWIVRQSKGFQFNRELEADLRV